MPLRLLFLSLSLFYLAVSTCWAGDIRTALAQNAAAPDVRRFYAARDNDPVWDTSAKNKAGLNSFFSSLASFIAYHGLSNHLCPMKEMEAKLAALDDENDPRLEIQITNCLIAVGNAMQGKDTNLSHLYPGWEFSRPAKDTSLGLGNALVKGKVQEFFDSLAPQSMNYARLATALQTYRAFEKSGAWPSVPAGETIRPGQIDPRLAAVRARLAAEDYALPQTEGDPNLYTDAMKDAVIAYQSRNGLKADGDIGRKTLAAMNVSLEKRIAQIRANMERMRHMPEVFPSRYVIVNIADASMKIVEDNETIYHGVVIVGRRDRKTPFIESAVRSVIFNPSWTVPDKIAREDILPKLRKDPHYLEKMGFVIKGSAEDPHGENVDWATIEKSEFAFRLRQSPGDLNSLGRVKFDFDNDFAVYLHDTSHPELFAKADRALSSGCVRVKDPLDLAVFVLSRNNGPYTRAEIEALIETGKTKWVPVLDPLPLYVVYDTAFFPTPESLIHFRKDIYNYDSFLIERIDEKKSYYSNDL